jgi:hypothetical protein
MIAGDESDRFDFVRLEAAEVAVLHEIVGVLVVPLIADEHADVVEDGRRTSSHSRSRSVRPWIARV